MTRENVYSMCGMCSVRCPIVAETENGRVVRLQGNPHAPGVAGSLCPRGAAGMALSYDVNRPKGPLIRAGERGQGKWREVSWDEALDHVAEKLAAVTAAHGAKSVMWSDRGGAFNDLTKAFMRGLGSPNYHTHDSACGRNVHHAALSLFGLDRKDLALDLKNARHVVLQTRNIFESVNVAEVNNLLDAMDAGCKLSVVDIRATVSASKADNFFLIRPGTDYAFNLAVINVLLTQDLYDNAFAARHIDGLDALAAFIEPYTPVWAEAETGIAAARIVDLAEQLAAAAPQVAWHPGWMSARYRDSFQVAHTAYIINALLGSVGAKGGLAIANCAADVGRPELAELTALYPKSREKRADGAGGDLAHIDAGPGLFHLALKAVASGVPYPVKAYIAFRHDPLMAYPDPGEQRRILDKLDLMVAVTFTWSDTAWFSDVVLPLSPYLERESIVSLKKGPRPSFVVRRRAMQPVHDTRADWEIISGLSGRLGLDKLAFKSIEDIWAYQLAPSGLSMADFAAAGMVFLAGAPHYRTPENLAFKTPSGKIEIVSARLEKAGLSSLAPYRPPQAPPEGEFRLAFGRAVLHTQGHTVDNPVLFARMPENVLWINAGRAAALGIENGGLATISGKGRGGVIRAFVTEFIHPEAVFMVHGFGHDLPVEERARGRGVADNALMNGGLFATDPYGGGVVMQEHFVRVAKA
ncbi:MAG: molybdopterin-dependent oxidoreductase [Desulfovibrionaceae bacterium]|nr:molybdopterin-dependent oxidoreductase [Desulfovibrionaceae bacterium]MBF0512865.1 molybdopterin-dependent oxidoreductase [Desulfovibrionaceae bacterium]